MKKIHLQQLKKRLRDFPHTTDQPVYKEWRKAGMPYCWVEDVEGKRAVVYYDTGHGYVALFENDKLTAISEAFCFNLLEQEGGNYGK